MLQVISSIQYIYFRKTSGLNIGVPQLSSWLGHHLTYITPLCVGSAKCPECPRTNWRCKSYWLHMHGKAAQRSSKDQV